ncbi:unnamed protein product [Rhizoctonia solani]|uniref:F-box domain-containing protein n=1 Tax=Rhizoctonia solani TaxID=456999 RepID=A0A8H3HVS8_9AGAM|nr:unnamed protein product [Rhizoctonia solani]
MDTTPLSEEARANREQENNNIWINRLPTEILSRIFVIGEDMDQDKRPEEDNRNQDELVLQFQELVVQVCRKWRMVALSMPMVRYSFPEPTPADGYRDFSSGQRSGQTIPLEIEIDLPEHLHPNNDSSSEDSDDQESEANVIKETLDSLVSKGADSSRWAGLTIWFEKPKAMFTVIDLLVDAPLSNLRKLSLINTYSDPIMVEDHVVEAMRDQSVPNSSLFRDPPPLLRELELIGIPSSFFFAQEDVSPVSNLTHLDLGFLLSLPPLVGLHALLVQNPRLESLRLDTGMIETADFQHKSAAEIRVSMPSLRRFSLQEPISVGWGLSVIQMIDAPELEAFALNLDRSQTLPDPIPFHIAYGKEIVGEDRLSMFPRHPIYPALKHLALGPFTGTSLALLAILEALRTITRLDWELEDEEPITINQVLGNSKLCPRLEHIRVHGVNEADLIDLVQSRIRAGLPLKTVEVNSRDWPTFLSSTKGTLSRMLEKFGPYIDENESDSDTSSGSESESDLEGWTDTDMSEADGIATDLEDDSDEDSTDDGHSPTLGDEGVFTDNGSDSSLD